MSYTKGPWIVEKGEGWSSEYPRKMAVRSKWSEPANGSLGYEICRLSGVNDASIDNANLIATAPELLEALKDCEAFIVAWACHRAMQGAQTMEDYRKATSPEGWDRVHREIYAKFKNVIAKAEGK